MLAEIEQQNVFLTTLDGKPTHGFATPCGQSLAAAGFTVGAALAASYSWLRGKQRQRNAGEQAEAPL